MILLSNTFILSHFLYIQPINNNPHRPMIPNYQQVMLPLLRFLSDGQTHTKQEAKEHLSRHFNLSDTELNMFLPSGRQLVFHNRVSWAAVYLKKALLIESPSRGRIKITNRGMEHLRENPGDLKTRDLLQYPEFREFKNKSKQQEDTAGDDDQAGSGRTPEEELEEAYLRYRLELASELLDQVKSCSPAFFERLVVDLITKIGYGGTRKDAGAALGRSGDGGIDGLIKEDRLGLDTIYIQAKKWENPVPIKEVRDFAGALLYKKARKGIFITTSSFPASAQEFVKGIDPKVILIDGSQMTDLMIENGVGLTTINTFSVCRLDTDYFEE
ncbi:MAG: restriction endonuclease [Candidatus Methanomethylophilaceae archaeon]|nr:restriction endonuclease [Candidatus Methanomethylophilaceae archaeon]